MTLVGLLESVLSRYRKGLPNAPSVPWTFGLVTLTEQASLRFSQTSAEVLPHTKEAEYLLYGSLEDFAQLFDPAASGRAALAERLELRPNYPFNTYLLSVLLGSFDLVIPDLNYKAKRFEGPFPFPPRYPASENAFRQKTYQPELLPSYNPQQLPQLVADNHPLWVAMYDFAWRTAFNNLRQPESGSGFVSNFIDTAFNDNSFMWDSCFMTQFGVYGRRGFGFMGTLENFYAKQHDDGFICREINTYTGNDLFQSLDPRSTGPNILAWTEWQYFQHSRDNVRLTQVFPALVAYHRWWRDWRTHPSGAYWNSGWGSGMDNQSRIPHSEFHHRHHVWLDANAQQALSCKSLLEIAAVIGRDEFDRELQNEYEFLQHYINTQLWDEASGFYYDAAPDRSLSQVKSIGAYWALLAGVVPPQRQDRFIAHLSDPQSFNRPHRVPTQAADSTGYNPYGGYWLGGVWSPTNQMVLAGLGAVGEHLLAHEIALNHFGAVAQVFAQTGTLWENYAPEYPEHGRPAGRDFVGWTGLSAIAIPIEYVIGISSSGEGLRWDIRLNERHGVLRYPLGDSGEVSLVFEPHGPLVWLESDVVLDLELHYKQQIQTVQVEPGQQTIRL